MHSTLRTLVGSLADGSLAGTEVIPWASPVPFFGDPLTSVAASLGINPSKHEFLDEAGDELRGEFRRLYTLSSLGLSSWQDAEDSHLRQIHEGCIRYFAGNPYDLWFGKLEPILNRINLSYYDGLSRGLSSRSRPIRHSSGLAPPDESGEFEASEGLRARVWPHSQGFTGTCPDSERQKCGASLRASFQSPPGPYVNANLVDTERKSAWSRVQGTGRLSSGDSSGPCTPRVGIQPQHPEHLRSAEGSRVGGR